MAELWEGTAGGAGDTGLGWGVTGLSVGTPGRAECGTQQGPGAESSWAMGSSALHPSGCVPHCVPALVALQGSGGLGIYS